MLGTSDAWLMSHLSHRPNELAYYIEDYRIFEPWNSITKVTPFETSLVKWNSSSTKKISHYCHLPLDDIRKWLALSLDTKNERKMLPQLESFSSGIENLNYVQPIFEQVKFVYSKKATKFCKIVTLLLSTEHTDKSKVKISQNFVAFSEYMNFIKKNWLEIRLTTLP